MEDNLPRKTEKPWGYELLYALTTVYAGKIIFVKKGQRLSLQYHEEKDESMYIQQGQAMLTIEGDDGNLMDIVVKAGDSIHIPPYTKHRIKALENTTILEVSTTELEDIVRIEDDYGRSR